VKYLYVQVDRETGTPEYLDAVDESQCNWMMFVRPAASYAEQNLVAHQFGADIYFTTIKNIEARQELKVDNYRLLFSNWIFITNWGCIPKEYYCISS